MGMRKFWSVALPFGKVACAVKVLYLLILLLIASNSPILYIGKRYGSLTKYPAFFLPIFLSSKGLYYRGGLN